MAGVWHVALALCLCWCCSQYDCRRALRYKSLGKWWHWEDWYLAAFGGQRGNPLLITSALILAVTLGLALLALIRSFLIRPEEEQSEERLAA